MPIKVAHRLAKDLNVSLEFVLLEGREAVADSLNSGVCDSVMPGLALSPGRSERVAFSTPYMDVTLSFLVEDHLKDEFGSWEAARALDAPRLGLPTQSQYYRSLVQAYLPNATLVPLSSPRVATRLPYAPRGREVGYLREHVGQVEEERQNL